MNKRNIGIFISGIILVAGLISCDQGKTSKSEPEMKTEQTASVGGGDDAHKGKDLYQQNGCAGCHGEDGTGDGPAGQALNPKPRNFTKTGDYKQGTGIDDIAHTIETGISGTAMVAYPHIPEGDRKLIASFIVSLQK